MTSPEAPPVAPRPRARGLVAPFGGVFLRRSLAYWALLNLALVAFVVAAAAMDGQRIDPVQLIPGGNALVPLFAGGLGMLEARRRDEDLFLANLGYGWLPILAHLTLPAAIAELLFTLAARGW
jgi:hypothetical protein